jgi:hypothetical protein
MENFLSQFFNYLSNVIQSTLYQLFILFGLLLVLVVLLNFSARFTARLSVRFWGRNLFLYGFGWLGCSAHELSHAFFAFIFGHKINEIALFKPNSNGESLGHVSHSYNQRNFYQKAGNFFIGAGPLLAGGIVLFMTTLLLFHINIAKLSTFRITSHGLTDIQVLKQMATAIQIDMTSYFNIVFSGTAPVWWKSVLVIYVLYSTGSSMTLSKSDVRSAISGFISVLVIFLLFNLLTLWISNFASDFLFSITGYISGFYFLLILSLIANLLFIAILLILNFVKSLIFVRR